MSLVRIVPVAHRPTDPDGQYYSALSIEQTYSQLLENMFAAHDLIELVPCLDPFSGRQYQDAYLATFPDFSALLDAKEAWNSVEVEENPFIIMVIMEDIEEDTEVSEKLRHPQEPDEVTLCNKLETDTPGLSFNVFEDWWAVYGPHDWALHQQRLRRQDRLRKTGAWLYKNYTTGVITYSYDTAAMIKYEILSREEEPPEIVELIDWDATRKRGRLSLRLPVQPTSPSPPSSDDGLAMSRYVNHDTPSSSPPDPDSPLKHALLSPSDDRELSSPDLSERHKHHDLASYPVGTPALEPEHFVSRSHTCTPGSVQAPQQAHDPLSDSDTLALSSPREQALESLCNEIIYCYPHFIHRPAGLRLDSNSLVGPEEASCVALATDEESELEDIDVTSGGCVSNESVKGEFTTAYLFETRVGECLLEEATTMTHENGTAQKTNDMEPIDEKIVEEKTTVKDSMPDEYPVTAAGRKDIQAIDTANMHDLCHSAPPTLQGEYTSNCTKTHSSDNRIEMAGIPQVPATYDTTSIWWKLLLLPIFDYFSLGLISTMFQNPVLFTVMMLAVIFHQKGTAVPPTWMAPDTREESSAYGMKQFIDVYGSPDLAELDDVLRGPSAEVHL
jgi:hypothetical protein